MGDGRLQRSVEPCDVALFQPVGCLVSGELRRGDIEAYQFKVSGDTVASLYLDLAHVRQEAFSSRDLWPYTFRCETMCRQEDQISSSRQS